MRSVEGYETRQHVEMVVLTAAGCPRDGNDHVEHDPITKALKKIGDRLRFTGSE